MRKVKILTNLKRVPRLIRVLVALEVLVAPFTSAYAEDFDRIYQVTLQLHSTPIISEPNSITAHLNLSPNPGIRSNTWKHHFGQTTGTYTLDQYKAKCHLTSDKVGASDDGVVTCNITAQLSKDVKSVKASGTELVSAFLSKVDFTLQLRDGMANQPIPENKYFAGTASVKVISS